MTSQEWSLEDVLSLLFGEEAKFIVPIMRGRNLDGIPKSVYKNNKTAKDKIVDGFTGLAENYYGGTFGDDYFPSTVLDVSLNPLIVTCWLRDEEIFEELFFSAPFPEGTEEKLASLKESVAKEFDSIDLKELSRADYWSKQEFYALLFGNAYSDTFFPRLLQQFSPKLEQYISEIDKFIIGAIEKGDLVVTASNTSSLLPQRYYFQDNGNRFEPLQFLAVLDSKGYPIPHGLMESISERDFDEAGKLLDQLREMMLYHLEHGKNLHQLPKKAPPSILTDRGRNDAVREEIKRIAVRLFKENPNSTYGDLITTIEVRDAIDKIHPDSSLTRGTLTKWFRQAAKENGFKRKSGRPRKN